MMTNGERVLIRDEQGLERYGYVTNAQTVTSEVEMPYDGDRPWREYAPAGQPQVTLTITLEPEEIIR